MAKVAFITGASRGIGKQLAQDFAIAGYDIAAVARSTADTPTKLPGTVNETAQLVEEAGQQCLPIGANLAKVEDLDNAVAATYDRFGQIDVLINNAAIAPPGKALESGRNLWSLAVGDQRQRALLPDPRGRAEDGRGRRRRGDQHRLRRGGQPRLRAGQLHDDQAGARSHVGVAGQRPQGHAACRSTACGWSCRSGARATPSRSASRPSRWTLRTRSSCPTPAFGWFAQGPDWTGRIVTIADLRKYGAVRPRTRKTFDE